VTDWRAFALACVVWLCGIGTSAAEARLKFDHLRVEDGLSNNWVRAVLRDSRGFLWVGTRDGLDRYDGHSFIHYSYSPDDPQTIPYPQVAVLYEDSRKRLWFGSGRGGGGGLASYDRAKDRFVRFPPGAGSGAPTAPSVLAILEDHRGRFWAGTESSLDLVDRERGTLESYPALTSRSATARPLAIYALADDDRDGLWVTTEEGLLRFDPQRKQFLRWTDRQDDPTGLDHVAALDLLKDREGALWIGTSASGLYRLDPRSGRVTHFEPRRGDPSSLSQLRVRRLAADAEGRIWIGTSNGGLNILQPGTEAFQRYLPDVEDERSPSSASVLALHIDDQGIVWVGTYSDGLSFVSPFGQSFEHIRARRDGLSDSHVASILEDASGNLWVGTDGGGLNRIDRATGRYTYYRHDPERLTTMAANAVHALLEDSSGAMWIGGWAGGLGRLDRRTGRVTRFLHDPKDPKSIVANHVWRILELKSGELLVATQAGVDLFDRRTATFARLKARYPQADLGRTFVAVEDAHGNLWLGGENTAQYVDRSRSTVRTYDYHPDDPHGLGRGVVAAIHVDSRGNVWLGTESGLNCLPASTQRMRRYTTADGMPHDTVTNILEDSSGSLWLTTNRGLSKLVDAVHVPDRPRFLNFDVHDGLQGQEFTRGAAFKGRAGKLYFGGSRGLNVFFPEDVRQNLRPPPVVLTDLRIFNRSVAPGAAGSPLERSITETSELTLSYRQSIATLEFAALNLVLPQKNRYAYKLDGVDPDWNYVGSRNSVTYTNIPPGSHVFHVRASNNDGVWNDAGVALRLTVTPPFWETWWFQLPLGLGVAAGLVLTSRQRMRRLRARAQELAETVQDRTRELRALNEQLEERVVARTRELEGEKERLAVTLRSIGDGVVATDVSGRVLLLNRVAEQLTGWELDEAAGRPLREVCPMLHPESRQPQPDLLEAALAGQAALDLPSEGLLVHRDGGEVRIASSVAPIRDSESRVVGVVLVFRDVTEKHRVEEQLQTAQKLEALGILAGGIAHDFNNLLTGVFGYIDLADRRSADPKSTRDTLAKALAVLRKARGLTGQLLTFSRAGQPVTAPLSLSELLRNSARFAMSGSNVLCEVEIPAHLWSCQGDEQQVDQVIDNLLVNARQAMPQGGTIHLIAENVVVPDDATAPVADGRYVRVTVRDQGTGIPADIRGRVFEPFFTTKPTGTGLGLATAYSIVRKHGGHIEVESTTGMGTTFCVYLPASIERARTDATPTPDAARGHGRILLLDDEEYVRDVASESLKDLGFSVETVSAGEQAVEAYQKALASSQPFDVVILDLTIPGGMGGVAVLSRLRAIRPTVRAIATSGYSGDSVMASPETHGFQGRLTKPYTTAELGEVIARVLRRE
jgi:PAS domain S-box-containing protein